MAAYVIVPVPSFVSFLAVGIHGLSYLVVSCVDDRVRHAINMWRLGVGMPVSAAYAVVFKT